MVTKSKNYNDLAAGCSAVIALMLIWTAFVSGIILYEQVNLAYSIVGYDLSAIWFPSEYGIDINLYPEMKVLREYALASSIVLASSGLLAILFVVLSLIFIGRRNPGDDVELKIVDKIPTEIQLFIMLLSMVPLIESAEYLASAVSKTLTDGFGIRYHYSYSHEPRMMEYAFSGVLLLLGTIFFYICLLSIVKKLKGGYLIKQSIFGMLLFSPVKKLYKGGSTGKRAAILLIIGCLLSATVVLVPFVLIVAVIYASRLSAKFDEMEKGLDEVCSGNLEYKIPLQGDSDIDRISKKINYMAKASNKAVQNELKSQRMKTDLITNVSHDLKTPLTSMITYVDLLKQEGLDGEHAGEYLDIIEQKTKRLKQLTEDLFEAAKASSGSIPINLSKVAVNSIINQSLGELSDKIDNSSLEFIVNAPEQEHYVLADGRQLWRVFENLIGNALKYAQPESRVYIDVSEGVIEKDGENIEAVKIVVKNVSRDQLNIDADTLIERFTRGDASRSVEGSGLGLAISNDLMGLMQGKFKIEIDGDLFKANLLLPKFHDEEVADSDEKETEESSES